MSFVHCHDCFWQQDDFWDDSYSPFRKDIIEDFVRHMNDGIHGKRYIGFDIGIIKELGLPYSTIVDSQMNKHYVEFRDYLAWELKRKAKNIRSMHWITYEDYKNDPLKRCPKCDSVNLDID